MYLHNFSIISSNSTLSPDDPILQVDRRGYRLLKSNQLRRLADAERDAKFKSLSERLSAWFALTAQIIQSLDAGQLPSDALAKVIKNAETILDLPLLYQDWITSLSRLIASIIDNILDGFN